MKSWEEGSFEIGATKGIWSVGVRDNKREMPKNQNQNLLQREGRGIF